MDVQNPMVVSTAASQMCCFFVLLLLVVAVVRGVVWWCSVMRDVHGDVVSKYRMVQYKVLRRYNSCTLDVLPTKMNNLSFL